MDIENGIKALEKCRLCDCDDCTEEHASHCPWDCIAYDELVGKAIKLLKEQRSLLGIHQTADGITFISTGTSQQGEERGIMLGKAHMYEWLKNELLYRGLLTDEIRSVFDEA